MLGYVRPLKAEMKVREFQRYQAVYCALCKSLGQRFGQLKRLAVTYDAAFLALFFLSFHDEENSRNESCVANPLQKRAVAAPHPLIEYAADITAILFAERGRDDWRDGQYLRALSEKALFARPGQKASLLYPKLHAFIQAEMEAFRRYEKQEWEKPIPPALPELIQEAGRRAETAAGYNGRMLREIFLTACGLSAKEILREEKYRAVIAVFAEQLGQWIYLMDAADDREKDIRYGRFNPFRGLDRKSCSELAAGLLEKRENSMDLHAALLPYLKDAEIIRNIVTMGLPAERARLLSGKREQEDQRLSLK